MFPKGKITLKPPYSKAWKDGYVSQATKWSNKGRRVLILVGYHGERSSTPYSRYLMSVKLGRSLKGDEVVDHINNDRSDDRLENLQILSNSENVRKDTKRAATMLLICSYCGTEFERLRKNVIHRPANNKVYCGRRCHYSGLKK